MRSIEDTAKRLRDNGAVDKWLQSAEAKPGMVRLCLLVRCILQPCLALSQVSAANGPMLHKLASYIGYHDASCIDLFKNGGELAGPLARLCLSLLSASLASPATF